MSKTWNELRDGEQEFLEELYNNRHTGVVADRLGTVERYNAHDLEDLGLMVNEDGIFYPSAAGCSVYEARLPLPDRLPETDDGWHAPDSPLPGTPERAVFDTRMIAGQAAVEMPIEELESEYVRLATRVRELEAALLKLSNGINIMWDDDGETPLLRQMDDVIQEALNGKVKNAS